jgi:hypothetical protein
MIYELSNPSDQITFEADDDKVASACCLILGHGNYGLNRDGETVVPIFLFAKEPEVVAWLEEHGLKELGEFMDAHAAQMAECLSSSAVCSVADRKAMKAVVSQGGSMREALDAWNDAKRTSISDICGRAMQLADQFRKIAEEKA